MNREPKTSLIAGNLVKFVCLDPKGDEKKDTEFSARCHFLPSIGDRVNSAGFFLTLRFVKSYDLEADAGGDRRKGGGEAENFSERLLTINH